ncbi:hypothetical protein BDN72DRAFT_890999 [Pluteus cervinus]|uniref:Uncharacterized protein n=1 Tax=Pluteus cervinus TaxID=181527 RepID=A0ACD3BGS9_9AGAR|nr:hypothetical protein BDN72DRAFT_890999 [Pluteus cervinus]
MAVPQSLTNRDLSGIFVMNKTLSGSTDELLRLQGVGWFIRKAIAIATITLYVKHYIDADGLEHIDIDQTLTGGIPGTTEKRELDWTERDHKDHIFGAVKGKDRRVKVDELEDDFLKLGWTEDSLEDGLIQSYSESDTARSGTSWIANQTWGFEMIQGEKRHSRHVKFTGPGGEDIEVTLVYDYLKPLPASKK